MPATTHLVLGPPGADRLTPLVAAYREATGGLALVPTRRHAEQFRAKLDAPALLAPHVLDLQAFADELVRADDPTLRPLSDIDRRLLLDSVLAELRDANELPYFAAVADTRGFAEAAAGYVEELTRAGVDLRMLLRASPARQSGGELNRHAQAVRIFDRYLRRVAKLHRLGPDDRVGRAAELWADGRRTAFAGVRSIFVAGFTALKPFERKLLDALRDTAEHFWIALPDGEGEVRAWASGPVGEASLFNPGPEVVTECVGEPGGVSRRVVSDITRRLTPPGSPGKLHLIEAPGALGEARLVARQVRTLLAEGTPPDRVLVAARHLPPTTVELLREVFDEYAIPHDAEGAEPLARVPAVAFLLRAWRLHDDDWPFAPVAVVLRSTFFRPNWPEVRDDPELPAKAETLLRMLGETRGRDAYLAAVRAWEHAPPEALEDEQAEEPRRLRTQRLARRCRPFLERFFRAWDRFKPSAPAASWVTALKAFADDTGLSLDAGLERFWHELGRWAAAEAGSRKAVRADRFARVLAAIASVPCRGRTPREPGRVRILSAEAAAGLECDHLFLTGLGEGSWPDLSAPVSLLDDAERDRLRSAGFALPDPAARLAAEQELFRELIAAPRKGVFLSYAAVDDQGQPLLPCTFLRELKASLPEGSIPTTRQRMLIEGYFTREPLSAAEARVQYSWRAGGVSPLLNGNEQREETGGLHPPLAQDTLDNLARAIAIADARFRATTFGPYDGELRHPAVTAELAKRFGPERVLSPTALEAYVACPFRFWLEDVLRLDLLEDPADGVEHTRRGAAFHRALARFHRWIKENVQHTLNDPDLPEGVGDSLLKQIADAVEEYALRAPSAAGRELWRLEGRRLARAAGRYRGHWQEFRTPWHEQNATPVPAAFEAAFGGPGAGVPEALTINVGGVEVRIGGVIDRIDTVELGTELGYWVIDYKTGRAANYTASQVERFEKLQLPLYALAVERVLFKDRPARPLGLAYWLVTDAGAKPVLPAGKRSLLTWLADPGRWAKFRDQLEAWVATLATRIRSGDFPLSPRSDHCTDTCGFGPVCRIAQGRDAGKPSPLPLPLLPKGE